VQDSAGSWSRDGDAVRGRRDGDVSRGGPSGDAVRGGRDGNAGRGGRDGDWLPGSGRSAGDAFPWRVRSSACAAVDVVVLAAGLVLIGIVAVDCVRSWSANDVLISDPQLARIAGLIVFPGYLWLFASAFMLRRDLVPFRPPFGERLRAMHWDRSRRPDWAQPPAWAWRPTWARTCIAVIAAVSAGVIIGSYVVGTGKGSSRILAGPRYQISSLDLNNARWTTVPASQYRLWQAEFVRGDSPFTLFGCMLLLFTGYLLLAHWHARRDGA
jgi:hypothetical protein